MASEPLVSIASTARITSGVAIKQAQRKLVARGLQRRPNRLYSPLHSSDAGQPEVHAGTASGMTQKCMMRRDEVFAVAQVWLFVLSDVSPLGPPLISWGRSPQRAFDRRRLPWNVSTKI